MNILCIEYNNIKSPSSQALAVIINILSSSHIYLFYQLAFLTFLAFISFGAIESKRKEK